MRLLGRLFLPVSVAILLAAAALVPLPLFLELPGALVGLGDKVSVSGDELGELDGDFLLTTVGLRRGTVVGVSRGLLADDVTVVPEARLLPPGVRESDYFERQRAVFASSADVAAAVGLQAAGLEVDATDFSGDGVVVVQVLPGSAADGLLRPGDVIVGYDGVVIGTGEELRRAVMATTRGRAVLLRLERDEVERTVELVPRPLEGESDPVIGVQVQTLRPRLTLPVPVEVDSGRIGGPSAGLMIALTVYDKAADDDLAAGRLVAGTGTVGPDGSVGPVGGVGKKALAAHRAGVDVFLAPAEQVDEALDALPVDHALQVVPVATFDDALISLRDRVPRTAAA